jgi:glycosyltransferase involved in cell wall biosynthesis
VKFCVIITTKDRPEMLGKLLESIEKNQVKPNLLSIVSSGIDVKNIISKHNSNLKILHTHLNESGQVLQRNKAINNLKEDFDYYVFLDDDVIVDDDIFLNLVK